MYRTIAFEDGPSEIFSVDSLRESKIETFRGHKTSRRTILVCSLILIATAGLLATWIFVARPHFYPKLGVYTRSISSYEKTDFINEKRIFKNSRHYSRGRRAVKNNAIPDRTFNIEILTNQSNFPVSDGRLPLDIIPEEYFLDLKIDVDSDNFTGSVKLIFTCDRKTDKIIFHGRRIVLTNASIILEKRNVLYKRLVYLKKFELFVLLLDGELIEGKKYELNLEYTVGYGKNLAGLYKSNYTNQGEVRSIVSTHFEPTDARSAFPCLDEPFFKAIFHVSITHHKNLTALSNMPLKQTSIVDNHTVHDEFEASVRMSTYLVAFTVNDFKYKETNTSSGIKVRVYAREDDYNRIDYAVEAGAKIISFYEDFFQIKYPLPKLDLLAVPDFMAGAMEDWGLVSFRSAYLIFDKELMTVEYLRQVTLVIAHELAHQWFGNLVTMKWWNDIWLNEGFANFVEMLGTNRVNEEFNALDIQVPTGWQAAIGSDSLRNSHPVSQNVSKTSEIDELFDTISYNKGAALLRMVQGFMGENFIKGVKSYLEEYKFSNAETDDLWKHLSKSSDSKLDIKSIMDTWTMQRSFPILTLHRGNDSKFIVSQESFLEAKSKLQVENSTNITDVDVDDFNASVWQVPLTYISDESLQPKTVWLKSKDTKLDLDTTVSWMKANVDSKGFYIVNYDNSTWKALQKQLVDNHEVFSPINRAGLLHDAFKLACEELLDPIIALEMTKYLSKEWAYIPWAMMRSRTECLYPLVHEKSVKLKLKKYFWKQQSHLITMSLLDYDNDTVKRNLTIFERLQIMESFSFVLKHHLRNDYRERVQDIFEELVQGKKLPITAEIRALALTYGYNSTKESHWDYLWQLYVKSEVDTDRKIVMKAFAQFKEKEKVAQILERSLDKNTMRVQDTIPLLANIVKIGSRQQVWEFVVKNYDNFRERYGGGYQLGQLMNEVAGGFSTWKQYKEVKEFFDAHPIGAKGSRTEKQILEKIRNNIRRHADRDSNKMAIENIKHWLEQEENK